MKEMEEMAINEVPVGLDEILFISAAEDFQKETNEAGEEVNRLSFDGDSYQLDVQISALVEERGLPAFASQAVTVEVPVEGAQEALKKIRSIPRMTEVKFESLTMRSGVTARGRAYAMWTGKGLQTTGKSAPSAPAPAAAQRQG